MISLDFEPGRRFSFRVVAVCVDDGYVLLHRADYENFWSLPGGRAEILESSPTTVVREMQEELGVTVKVRRLLWVVENFFTFESRRFHELGLYYLVDLPAGSPFMNKAEVYMGQEADLAPLTFKWFPQANLDEVKLVPRFLNTALRHLPRGVEHVIHEDQGDIQAGEPVNE